MASSFRDSVDSTCWVRTIEKTNDMPRKGVTVARRKPIRYSSSECGGDRKWDLWSQPGQSFTLAATDGPSHRVGAGLPREA